MSARSGKGGRHKEEEKRLLQSISFSQEQVNHFLEMTLDEVQSQFERILGFRHRKTCLRAAIQLDYYVSGFWWAKEVLPVPAQVSFVMDLIHMLLENMKEKQMGLVDNWMELAKALEESQRCPASEGDHTSLLDQDQAKALTKYIKDSLFQYYRLYELLLTTPREERLFALESKIEVISGDNTITPLEEGMSADMYFRYLAPPPVQEQEEVEQDDSGELQQNEKEVEESSDGATLAEELVEVVEAARFSIQDVKEVLAELAHDMLGTLQADFSEKLRVHEETYTARLGSFKQPTSK